jgi:hypothetical protein
VFVFGDREKERVCVCVFEVVWKRDTVCVL